MVFSFEEINDCLFVHVVFTLGVKKETFNKLKEVWHDFYWRAYFDGWPAIFTYTADSRIVDMVGGATEVGQDSNELKALGLRMFKWDF
jgi:hypothetical protein